MNAEWTPLADYSGANHVLGAGLCFVHPGNGNLYGWDCVQISGARQNLNIYRIVAKTGAREKVVTFEGTIDAERGFERGQCVIAQGGALWVATTMTPKGVPHVTVTGFQGVYCRIPTIDEPWGLALQPPDYAAQVDALAEDVAQLRAQIDALETALGTLSGGGGELGDADQEALRRLKIWLGIG